MSEKFEVGYVMVAVKDHDLTRVEWINHLHEQCERLIVGVPNNDVHIDLFDAQEQYDNQSEFDFWNSLDFIDEAVLLDNNLLSYQNFYEEHPFDVCFYGSEYGKKYIEDRKFFEQKNVRMLSMIPAWTSAEAIESVRNPLSQTFLDKEIILFGTGVYFDNYMNAFGEEYAPKYAVDNNSNNWGTTKSGIEVKSPELLKEENPDDILVIICAKNFEEIKQQVLGFGDFDYRLMLNCPLIAMMEELQFGKTLDLQGKVLKRVQKINYEMLKDFDAKCRNHNVDYFLGFGSLLGAVRHQAIIPWDNDVDTLVKRTDLDKIREFKDEFEGKFFWMPNTVLGNKKYFDCIDRICYRDAYINQDEKMDEYYENFYNSIHLDMFLIDKTYDNVRGKIQRFELAVLYGLMNAYRHESMFADYDKKMQRRNSIMCFFGRFLSLNWLKKRADKVARRFDYDDKAPYYFISNDVLAKLQMLFPAEIFDHAMDVPFGPMTSKVCLDPDVVLKALFKNYMKLPAKRNRVPHIGRKKMTADSYVFEQPKRGSELG